MIVFVSSKRIQPIVLAIGVVVVGTMLLSLSAPASRLSRSTGRYHGAFVSAWSPTAVSPAHSYSTATLTSIQGKATTRRTGWAWTQHQQSILLQQRSLLSRHFVSTSPTAAETPALDDEEPTEEGRTIPRKFIPFPFEVRIQYFDVVVYCSISMFVKKTSNAFLSFD